MKKFILSFAALALGVAAQAQGTWTPTAAITDAGEVLFDEDATNIGNLSITFGTKGWDLKPTYNETTDTGDKKVSSDYLLGKSNPIASASDKSAYGTSYDDGTETGTKVKCTKLPTVGAYVIYEPGIDGSIEVVSVINNDKPVFVLEVDGETITELNFNLVGKAYGVNWKVDGVEVTNPNKDVETELNYSFSCGTRFKTDKVYANLAFNVKASKKYYVFCTGSKMGFGKVELKSTEVTLLPEPTTPIATPVEDVVAENASKVIKTIENGQIVIVKNGVKYNVLGQIIK